MSLMYSMESSNEGRLGLQKIPYFEWKGKTFSQISSVIQKNNFTTNGHTTTFLKARPIQHYRREIASVEPNNTDPRLSRSVRLTMDAPGSTVVQTASTTCTGINQTLDIGIEDTKTNQPCNSCDDSFADLRKDQKNSAYLQNLSAETNARRRVRSAGMNRPRYDPVLNNRPENYRSSSQYLHGRNKTFKQNQFNNMRVENPSNSSENVYASNTIQYCGADSSQTQYVPVYYKPNNSKFAVQGAVDSSSRLARLKYDTITDSGAKMRSAHGEHTANALAYHVSSNGYTIKDKKGYPNICTPVIKPDGTLVKC